MLALQSLRSIVFPPICQICESYAANDRALCDRCENNVAIITQSCHRCGAVKHSSQSVGGPPSQCIHCRAGKWRADRMYCLAVYRGVVQQAIIAMKQPATEALGIYFGKQLAMHAQTQCDLQDVDAIVSVPQHWRKRVWHRHNSAEMLASAVARELGKPSIHTALCRIKSGSKQGMLQRTAREANIKEAFRVSRLRKRQLIGRHIVVVDDIVTTGATAAEICKILRAADVRKITFLAVGRGLSASQPDTNIANAAVRASS